MFEHWATSHLALLDIFAALGQEHLIGIDAVDALCAEGFGAPGGGGERVNVKDVHGVDFLEGAILGLDDKEEDDPEEGEEGTGKDESVVVVDVVGDEGGEEGDEEVEEPVGGRGECHAGGSVAGGVEFSDNGPD